MTRVAAIDCGTNSIRLLIADVDGTAVSDVTRRMEIVRLGEGVDATGRLSEAALDRTFRALDDYVAAITAADVPVDRIVMAATSATRDAANRDIFVAGVSQRLGVDPRVLRGEEEAELSFTGAASALADGMPDPWLVVDIGGGSTECVMGGPAGAAASISVDIGCVRITERCLAHDPPTQPEIAAAVSDIDDAMGQADAVVSLTSAKTVIGLAGSVTTVAGIALGLPSYDADAIHGATISIDDVHRVATELLAMPRQQRAALSVMHPGRVDVIGAGALILDRVLTLAGVDEVIASEHDILDGLAIQAAA